MMTYDFSYQNPSKQFIDITYSFDSKGEAKIHLQLPAWRPGRYELGNFAKNIQQFKVTNERGEVLPFKKLKKDLWEVESEGSQQIIVSYNYYADTLNAGSTYLDDKQLYVNPVNCCLYVFGRMDEEIQVNLKIDSNYEVATGLESIAKHQFKAKDFHDLADCPFIASDALQKVSYEVKNHLFHLWFQGEAKLNEEQLIKDFKAFTEVQIDLFGDFPCPEYHFLFQILVESAYHGVEHSNSTVIALGPSYKIMNWEGRYEDLLGVSSHELFHTWNVKRIRPTEMWPYDYSQENYSRLGYLAEGATTWYGDEQLYRSKVFDDKSYFKTVNQLFDRHFNNAGVTNLSVAESSFDTWLDGYVLGIPNRKSSIYVEGALITFMLDAIIRENTQEEHSFDDVMRAFYNEYYKVNKGITEKDYQEVVEKYAQQDLNWFFEAYVNGAEDFTPQLHKALEYYQWQWEKLPSEAFHEAYLGFRVLGNKVHSILPDSPAHHSSLTVGDEILTINGIKLNNDLGDWCDYFKSDDIVITVSGKYSEVKEVSMKAGEVFYYSKNLVGRIIND